LIHRHCAAAAAAPAQAAAALCGRQPPRQGAATPATGVAAPAGGRAGRGRKPLAGWPLPAGPCGLAATGWHLRAGRYRLALAGWPLATAPLQARRGQPPLTAWPRPVVPAGGRPLRLGQGGRRIRGAWMVVEGVVGLDMAGRGATLVLRISWFNCSSWIRANGIAAIKVGRQQIGRSTAWWAMMEATSKAIVRIAGEGGGMDDGYRGSKIAALILDDRTPKGAL
ncbi:hypothetical protein BHM03_00025094, partial [Ensete ventricosum]